MTSPFLNFFWWAAAIAGAIYLQHLIPGVDALAPLFLLSLQTGGKAQTWWLFLLFSLIQEGTGSVHFGSSMLWYGGLAAFFWAGQRFFVAENIFFVLLLAVVLGAYHALLALFMCAIQGIPVEYPLLVHESVIQTLVIPLIWGLVFFCRPRVKTKSFHTP